MANPFVEFRRNLATLASKLLGRKVLTSTGRIFSLTTPEVFSPIDQKNANKDGFSANIIVYTVIKKDAQKFGAIPRYVYDKATKEEKGYQIRKHLNIEQKAFKPITKSGLADLLNRPNPYQGQDAFYSLARASYKCFGEALVWCNRGDIEGYRKEDGTFDDEAIDKLPVIEMYVLPPDQVSIIPDPENLWGILGYVLEIGERIIIRKGDVIHWKDLNLNWDAGTREHLRGMPPLTPGASSLQESNYLSRAAMRMSQNDGAKAVIYNETMNQMSPQQQTDLKKVIDSKINNVDIAGAVATIQGKWGLLNLAMGARDMQMIERKKMSWREIALLFDVPPNMVDTEQKYDNLGEAMLQWVNSSIIPACKQFDGEMNRVLLKAFGLEKTAFISTDYTELPEVMKYIIESAKTLQDIWSIEPDAIRELLGYDRIGNEFAEPWVTSGRTPLSQMNDDMTAEDQMSRAYGRGS